MPSSGKCLVGFENFDEPVSSQIVAVAGQRTQIIGNWLIYGDLIKTHYIC